MVVAWGWAVAAAAVSQAHSFFSFLSFSLRLKRKITAVSFLPLTSTGQGISCRIFHTE